MISKKISAIMSIFCQLLLLLSATQNIFGCIIVTDNDNGRRIANCSGERHEHVPYYLNHNIRELDLCNNNIKTLAASSFVKYNSLRSLYLRNNSLSMIENRAFEKLEKLEHLDLSGNNLPLIPSRIFVDLPSLLVLNLRGNKINMIHKFALLNASRLSMLYLDGNHISQIDNYGFKGLEGLQYLNLKNNALEKLDYQAIQFFTDELQEIVLYNNPWYCDCDLRWLYDWLNNGTETTMLKWRYLTNEPRCVGPSLVRDQSFSTLSEDMFVCQVMMYSSGHNMILDPGESTKLFCKYHSDPPAMTQWLKNGKEINFEMAKEKYTVETEGDTLVSSTLFVRNFRRSDIAEYKCCARNVRSFLCIKFTVTLEGVDPFSVTLGMTDTGETISVQSAVISASVIGGFLLIIALIGAIIYGAIRMKRNKQEQREANRLAFTNHLKENGIIKEKQSETSVDERDGQISMGAEDHDPLYDSLKFKKNLSQPNSNTYISFKAELSDPEELQQFYTQTNRTKGSDGSQCESTSPLLDNCSPIVYDSSDPFYEPTYFTPRLLPRVISHQPVYISPHDIYDTYSSARNTLPNRRLYSTPTADDESPYKSMSVGSLGMIPPKKPPRIFHSRDSLSVYSNGRDSVTQLSMSLDDPYGTAV